jgi:LuxR family maltose regulon positive regulatory protein
MKIALAEIFYEWNRLDEAEEQIREGIRDNEPWDSISDVTGYIMLARILQAKRDQDGAAEVVQKLESRLAGHSLPQELQDELDTLKIRLLLANGNLQSAAEWADHVNLAEPPDFRQEHHRLALGYILLAQGRYTEAEHLLEKMANMALAGKRRARQIKFGLLLALARSGQGRIPEAIQLLDTCLSLAEPEGYVRVFLDTGEPARALLARYLELPAPTHSAYAQGMLSEFAGTPAPFVAGLPERLTGREFEVLRLLAQGCSNRQIAEKLFLAEGTVKYYVHAILQKLQVHSRTQAVIVAKERRLI